MDLPFSDGGGVEPASRFDEMLMDLVPLRRYEPLVGIPERHCARRDGNAFDLEHGLGHIDEQLDLLGNRHGQRVDLVRSLVRILDYGHVGQRHRRAGHRGGCPGDGGALLTCGTGGDRSQIRGGVEAPSRSDQRSHADTGALHLVDRLRLGVVHRNRLVPGNDNPGIGVLGAGGQRTLDGRPGEIKHFSALQIDSCNRW